MGTSLDTGLLFGFGFFGGLLVTLLVGGGLVILRFAFKAPRSGRRPPSERSRLRRPEEASLGEREQATGVDERKVG